MSARPLRRSNGRIQYRAGTGQFRGSTLADVGLSAEVCPSCCGINMRAVGAARPETCAQCGAVFVYATCAWSRKREPRHLGPDDLADMRSGAFEPCGRAAVALGLDRCGRCAEHVGLAIGEGA